MTLEANNRVGVCSRNGKNRTLRFLRPITPEGGIDLAIGADKITVERVLAKLREDGILKA